jgi:hypothetical protein
MSVFVSDRRLADFERDGAPVDSEQFPVIHGEAAGTGARAR